MATSLGGPWQKAWDSEEENRDGAAWLPEPLEYLNNLQHICRVIHPREERVRSCTFCTRLHARTHPNTYYQTITYKHRRVCTYLIIQPFHPVYERYSILFIWLSAPLTPRTKSSFGVIRPCSPPMHVRTHPSSCTITGAGVQTPHYVVSLHDKHVCSTPQSRGSHADDCVYSCSTNHKTT